MMYSFSISQDKQFYLKNMAAPMVALMSTGRRDNYDTIQMAIWQYDQYKYKWQYDMEVFVEREGGVDENDYVDDDDTCLLYTSDAADE